VLYAVAVIMAVAAVTALVGLRRGVQQETVASGDGRLGGEPRV
jgi:hypothetical protein